MWGEFPGYSVRLLQSFSVFCCYCSHPSATAPFQRDKWSILSFFYFTPDGFSSTIEGTTEKIFRVPGWNSIFHTFLRCHFSIEPLKADGDVSWMCINFVAVLFYQLIFQYSDMHEHRAVSHLLEGLGSRRLSHHYSMSEICEVVNTGNLQMLRHMVHNGATICYRDSNKRTPLWVIDLPTFTCVFGYINELWSSVKTSSWPPSSNGYPLYPLLQSLII